MRDCTIIETSKDRKTVFCVDVRNEQDICDLIEKGKNFGQKLKDRIRLIGEGNSNKQQFEKLTGTCRTIWEIRLPGKVNGRIYVKEIFNGTTKYLILISARDKRGNNIDKQLRKHLQLIDNYTYGNPEQPGEELKGIIKLIR